MAISERKFKDKVCLSAGQARSPGAMSLLKNIRALVLLAGGVRRTKFGVAINRSILDLPIDSTHRLIGHWYNQSLGLAQLLDCDELPLRILIDQGGLLPHPYTGNAQVKISVERDPFEYRGTGGLLRDISDQYPDESYILVLNGGQILLDSLVEIAHDLAATGGDAAVIAHRDSTPSGVMLIRCGVLRQIQTTGFVDIKEQALPLIAAQHKVRVLFKELPSGLPIRTMEDYILALQWYHWQLGSKLNAGDPYAEDWRPTFSIVEAGATVDPKARVHDSVVLAGAKIDSSLVLVRSVVCAGTVVRRDGKVVNELLEPA
jgi:NDP-sugar pyrophosphorylase family protein